MKECVNVIMLCALLCGSLKAQVNLVPNPSFENVISCPSSLGLEMYVSDWMSARETPDYFNSCATWSGASVPSNNFGFQSPNSGNGYIGLLTYRADSAIYTEVAGVQLTSPLIIGQEYYVCFKFCLTLEDITESYAASNKIGVLFSNVNYSASNQIPVNNFAHLWTDSIVTDTSNWSTFFGSFIADSAYSFFYLGNFFDKQLVDTITFGNVFGAYYYFDDICVSTDSLECAAVLNASNSILGLALAIYPNPAVDYFTVNNQANIPYNLTVFDQSGAILFEELGVMEESKTIDISDLNDGLFLIIIQSGEHILSYKLLKRTP